MHDFRIWLLWESFLFFFFFCLSLDLSHQLLILLLESFFVKCIWKFIICLFQGEVEQIAMMKPKGQTEHESGMLEYLEDIIGTSRYKVSGYYLTKLIKEYLTKNTIVFCWLPCTKDQYYKVECFRCT